MTYYNDYDNEPIGRGNPYYRCVHCKVSDPEINGSIEGHQEWCEYRKRKEQETRTWDANQIAMACAQAEISDSHCQSLLIVLEEINKGKP